MAKSEIPTPAKLRKLLRYEPETGALFWRERPPVNRENKNFNARFAGREALAHVSLEGRKCGRVLGAYILAHRAAWAIHHGIWPNDCIDHINGNPLDNRIENLRDVSRAENAKNQKRYASNKSGEVGVSFHRKTGKWQAGISEGGRTRYIGLFETLAEASAARKDAEAAMGFHKNHGRT